MIQLDEDLVKAIVTGVDPEGEPFKPNHNQMLYGKLD